MLVSCSTSAPYRQKPIGIPYKKYKAIQARRYVRKEVAIVPRQFREPSKLSLLFSGPTKVYYVNNNKINRNINKKVAAKRSKSQNNYSNYREATELAKGGTDRSNFSIYDK
jgi:lipopolysaccharide export LptBFGC system permease protein LptF